MGPDDRDEPPTVDLSVVHRREARRYELAQRRRVRRHKLIGSLVGVIVAVLAVYGTYAFAFSGDNTKDASASAVKDAPAPVRVDVGPPPVDPDPVTPASATPDATPVTPSSQIADPATAGRPDDSEGSLADQERAATGASADARKKKPVVWIQAGHVGPREPGYTVQTGASSGPFGNEQAFTTKVSQALITKLKRAGVDARYTPGLVTPIRSAGAAFVSIHSDVPEGRAALGYAITGANENYYHGEGVGTASPTPYSDSAPHRHATMVSSAVASSSRDLANRVSSRYQRIYTSANGARARYGGLQTPTGNPRMMRYYGYYRTLAGARILIECGAGGTDDTFLTKTDMIAGAISEGIVDHLRAKGLLSR